MKTFSHLWQYLAEFFLEWEMFQIRVVRKKPKTHILCSVTFFRKSCHLWDNVEKRGGARGTAEIWRMRVTCWISKVTSAQAQVSARAPTSTHARTHPHTRAHTRTEICNIYLRNLRFPLQFTWVMSSSGMWRSTYAALHPRRRHVPWPTVDTNLFIQSLFALRVSAPHHAIIRSDYTLNFYGLSFTASVSLYASCCRSYKVF
jgi:hypothetical protein